MDARIAIKGGSLHRIVSLLYQLVETDIAAARSAIARADLIEKSRAIAHAMRVIDESLLAPLDVTTGDEIAVHLRYLYQYLLNRMSMANLNTDDNALGECARLIGVLRENWDEVGDQVNLPNKART